MEGARRKRQCVHRRAPELVLHRDMRIALYTPSDRPDPAPAWGGPELVHLLARALDVAGHQAVAPSDFRSDVGHEEGRRQATLERRAAKHATRLVGTYRDLPTVAWPDAWLTCHLQHAAPDLIGPVVADTLAIPYLLVGASYARAEAGGARARWLSYTARAIARARAVLSLTDEDEESIKPLVARSARLYRLAPFLDPAPYRVAERGAARQALAAALPLDPARPWLLAVAPMRPGAALASWRLLGRSLGLIADPPWQLLAVGDGEVRALVEEALAPLGPWPWLSSPASAGMTRSAPPTRPATSTHGLLTRKPSAWPCWRHPPPASRWWPRTGPAPAPSSPMARAGYSRPATTMWPSPARWSSSRRTPRGGGRWARPAATRVRDHHGLEAAAVTLQRALDAALTEA